jgi:molybdate/tungstate transport system substrate-binding protein
MLARRLNELHRVPDLIILADPEVFPELLKPDDVTWYSKFARNRTAVPYTAQSRYADSITATNWVDVLRRPDVEVGRTALGIAPAGDRTLIMFQSAERFNRRAGLANSLFADAPERNVRPDAAQIAALVAAGELDYIYDYQSVAESNGFQFLTLPREIDLGDPSLAEDSATARILLRRRGSDTVITIAGHPIAHALSIPDSAPHAAAGRRLMSDLLSPASIRALRAAHVDMLDRPIVSGSNAPAELHDGTGG